jgi:hypothetical protein
VGAVAAARTRAAANAEATTRTAKEAQVSGIRWIV